jgi:hypothetical protein
MRHPYAGSVPIRYRCPFSGPGTRLAQKHGCTNPKGTLHAHIAAGARGIAKMLFFVAVAIFLVALIFGVMLGVLVF